MVLLRRVGLNHVDHILFVLSIESHLVFQNAFRVSGGPKVQNAQIAQNPPRKTDGSKLLNQIQEGS